MAGSPIARARRAKLEELGERKVFETYLEVGTVQGMMQELFTSHGGKGVRPNVFYNWLRAEDGRWERWQEFKKMRGHIEADKAYETAEGATEKDVRSRKLKVDTYKWRAGILNREEYGDRVQHDVTHDVGDNWLKAVSDAKPEPEEPDEPEQIEEADYTIEGEDE